jgi:hypothetical protein
MTSMILSGKSHQQRPAGELLRQDATGRVRTSRERREELLAEFERSGVSGARFAEMAGIKYPTFAGWLHARRKTAGTATAKGRKSVTWVEAVPTAVASVRVQLPGGAWMEIGSAAQAAVAAQLLRGLAQSEIKPC